MSIHLFLLHTNIHSFNDLIKLSRGDPTVFEPYWRSMGDKCRVVIKGNQSLSYLANPNNMCWFMEPKLEKSIRKVHQMVGNAVVDDDRQIVVGTGSSQLIQAVLFALSPPDQSNPTSVVCAAPYYSVYMLIKLYIYILLISFSQMINKQVVSLTLSLVYPTTN